MSEAIKALIAAGYRATMWLDGKGLSDEGVAVLGDLRSALNAIAAAEARPEPAAEPSRFADAVRNAREAAEHMAMRPTGPSDGVLAGITMWLCDAVEALAREMREVKK